ncbi:arogenate dehydratase/prephenate dehydratase 1, chloroplastic-like [Pyrus communis]|uniref:arogenate dehydratase/prephenate dehydratase 1, chloroplastic-like n=1 Tax=Pyrus communis TaxID=23211 RepID=UPI0035BFC9AD
MVASTGLRNTGAVASARAAKIYGLEILAEKIQTSVVFTLKALAVFALRGINLTKKSRPQKQRPLRVVDDSNEGSAKYFDYLFYIDFEASMAEPRAQYALRHLQKFARFLRVLGSYPMDTIP